MYGILCYHTLRNEKGGRKYRKQVENNVKVSEYFSRILSSLITIYVKQE
jgi:hypothetical protein